MYIIAYIAVFGDFSYKNILILAESVYMRKTHPALEINLGFLTVLSAKWGNLSPEGEKGVFRAVFGKTAICRNTAFFMMF